MAAKKTARKRVARKASENGLYSVSLKVNGVQLTGVGDTLDTAILALPKFLPKTLASIVVTKDGKASKPITLNIPALKRLFFPGMTGIVQRSVFSKRVAFFL